MFRQPFWPRHCLAGARSPRQSKSPFTTRALSMPGALSEIFCRHSWVEPTAYAGILELPEAADD